MKKARCQDSCEKIKTPGTGRDRIYIQNVRKVSVIYSQKSERASLTAISSFDRKQPKDVNQTGCHK